MRKCASCGSLLLGEADACARCGAALTTPPAGAAWPPEPASAEPRQIAPLATGIGRLSIPSPVPPPPPTDQAGAPPEFQQSWQPVTVAAPVPTKRSTPWGQVVVAVAIALVVGLAVLHLNSGEKLPAGTSAFVSGSGGVTYTSPDGSFQAQLPAAPVASHMTQSMSGQPVVVYMAVLEDPNYEMVAGSFTFPSAVPADRMTALLDQVMTAGIKGLNGSVTHKTLTTRNSNPAIEGSFKLPDGYDAKVLAVSTGSTLILAVVHAKTGTGRLFKAFEDSLIIR
jgi:hypothetical protein